MDSHLNRVELRGIVGRVNIQTINDNRMARISVATNYAYKDREGCAVIDTDWHNVIAWEGRKIACIDQIENGTKLRVVGRIRYQRYAGFDGVDRVAAEIVASEVNIIDSAKFYPQYKEN